MYLTRLTLDPRSAQARRDLSDAYEMHRTLVRAFVSDGHSAPPRFLWRLEAGSSQWKYPTLLVQANVHADWRMLENIPNYLQQSVETKVVNLDELIKPGCKYRFRLLANPTVTRGGKRYGLAGENEQMNWLDRQGTRCGFKVESSLITSTDRLMSRSKTIHGICIQRVCYEGLLTVEQADRLKEALITGIGPAKAFGCGMLSLARI